MNAFKSLKIRCKTSGIIQKLLVSLLNIQCHLFDPSFIVGLWQLHCVFQSLEARQYILNQPHGSLFMCVTPAFTNLSFEKFPLLPYASKWYPGYCLDSNATILSFIFLSMSLYDIIYFHTFYPFVIIFYSRYFRENFKIRIFFSNERFLEQFLITFWYF